jgi:hypothetical protein
VVVVVRSPPVRSPARQRLVKLISSLRHA